MIEVVDAQSHKNLWSQDQQSIKDREFRASRWRTLKEFSRPPQKRSLFHLLRIVLEQEVIVGEARDMDCLSSLVQKSFQSIHPGAFLRRDEQAVIPEFGHPGLLQLLGCKKLSIYVI
mgnify:CR=1 FL=1